MYTVYILENELTGRHYIGYTHNLTRRLAEHSRGKTKSLKKRGVYFLIYTERYNTKAEAFKREKEIKKYKGGNAFQNLIRRAAGSYNGSTTDSESVYHGPNPCPAALRKKYNSNERQVPQLINKITIDKEAPSRCLQ